MTSACSPASGTESSIGEVGSDWFGVNRRYLGGFGWRFWCGKAGMEPGNGCLTITQMIVTKG